uniref:asparagine--tRNA ligase n=1 Tax=Entamoeba histolytica TaxID=5759 RepID=A0A060N006_ENTHI|nr:asparaginyl-tRNA synthetase, putative [Entamoeba histolytica]
MTAATTTPVETPIVCNIRDAAGLEGKLVTFKGWAYHIRKARKTLIFVELRDGSGYCQCVIFGKELCEPEKVKLLTRECSLEITGRLNAYAGKNHPPEIADILNLEMQVTEWKVIGESPIDLENIINKDSSIPQKMQNRHIVIRSEHTQQVLQLRSEIQWYFRKYYHDNHFTEIQPPTIVKTQCEGGSTLFKLQYFNEPAYLTQSSQLYLESVIASLGKSFCMLSSYRAEQSRTVRHLAEYLHLEAELPFISFEDLLNHLEDLVCTVIDNVMAVHGDKIRKMNPHLKLPTRPFKRMTYADAIKYCNDHGILNKDKPFEYGEDISEKPERQMTDEIGCPIFMIHFPSKMKAFYMSKVPGHPDLTESVDLLMPGVGEIVGGSMRIWNYDELMGAYKANGLNPDPYYWYTQQRKYGSCPHGGYGLGVERLVMWLLGEDHIRKVCLYPRYLERCEP